MRSMRKALAVWLVMTSAGCVRVPSLDAPEDAALGPKTLIKVSDVVKRVKCEVYLATKDHLPKLVEKVPKDRKNAPGEPAHAVPAPPPTKENIDFDQTDPRRWFGKWDVTVKLELVLNDQAGLQPGVTFNSPLHNAYNLGAGANTVNLTGGPVAAPAIAGFGQSFNFGLGGGAISQAVRTDDVQFTVSLRELAQEFDPTLAMNRFDSESYRQTMKHYNDCADQAFPLPDNTFLDANLGLKEWVRSAIGPAEPPELLQTDEAKVFPGKKFRYLTTGNHPAVTASGPPKPQPVPAPPKVQVGILALRNVNAIRLEVTTLHDALAVLKEALDKAKSNLKLIKALQSKAAQGVPGLCPNISPSEVLIYEQNLTDASKPYADAAPLVAAVDTAATPDSTQPGTTNLAENPDPAKKQMMSYDEAISKLKQAETRLADASTPVVELQKHTTGLIAAYSDCKPAAKPKAQQDPPIDNMSHTIQFIVSLNANATPSWNLLRIKSGTSPALASISHSNTQTLSMVFAAPGEGKASNATQSKLLGLGIQSDLNRLLMQ
jgi:hypothetical protein